MDTSHDSPHTTHRRTAKPSARVRPQTYRQIASRGINASMARHLMVCGSKVARQPRSRARRPSPQATPQTSTPPFLWHPRFAMYHDSRSYPQLIAPPAPCTLTVVPDRAGRSGTTASYLRNSSTFQYCHAPVVALKALPCYKWHALPYPKNVPLIGRVSWR
jgi:hypothetical protein